MKSVTFGLILLIMSQAFSQDSLRYLALGDSYTLGEQVPESESWPFQLTAYLEAEGISVQDPEIIAVTGWRTDELQDSIASQKYKPNSFDLVSLLIGVNNQYQKKPFKQFKTEFENLLQTAIALSSKDEKGVFLVGIPDYSLSEFAKDEKLKKVSSRLKRYNRYIQKMSQRYDVAYYPLQDLSRPLHTDKSMLAEDLLHPSGKQYKVWVDSFKEKVTEQIHNF
ncbi:SGNH/GDSL hydrolase family protein [Psychroflexus sediminis]|uniref:Lysophospholipase L1 n=1 Tax=Psychroflexus sediminis TaxID=470826 RepID=A0A1G7WI58_9FLAO|nr:SGNH/GDSL hydrolase family protein [Psychroflexus sediminis]SDG71663.1 Lysophospholipase L1 [Psychroflexus sediminis]